MLAVSLTLPVAVRAQCVGISWGVDQVFSNADRSVQFLILQSAGPGTLAGRTLFARSGAAQHSFTFASDPADATKPVLVATQAFADLKLVTPDFIMPDGFLFVANGSLTLGSARWWCGGPVQYESLPTDGVSAYYRDMLKHIRIVTALVLALLTCDAAKGVAMCVIGGCVDGCR